MGLLDRMKGAAGDLIQGAKDKVTEVTGVDADHLVDAAGSVLDAGESVSDAVTSISEGAVKR